MEPLLKTKLFAPEPGQVVARPRLAAQMENGARRALTLVSAPPGYGKTTLVVQALASAGRPCAWLSLDERDNDPVRFFTYLIAALQRLDKNIGQAAQSLLALPRLPAAEALATSLINDLPATSSPNAPPRDSVPEAGVTLVLDDYHVIDSPFIHAAVEFLVQNAPPALHVILVTRQDPPFALARLRGRGAMSQVRAYDLRFTHEEAAEWLNRQMGLNLDETALAVLHSRTEGWVAGLQLTALSLQGRDAARVSEFMVDLGATDRYVMDYLLEEVMRGQTDERRRFLCQTAILDRFTAPLCDAVTGRTDSKKILAQLEQSNLFLVPLDGRREWYRYHHLFADFLRTELEASEQQTLHARAARWLDAHGLAVEAIEHALSAQEAEMAAGWIEQAAGGLLERGELVTLSRWLAALPEGAIRRSIDLTAYQGWTLYFTGQTDAAAHAVQAQGPAREAEAGARGRLLALRASLAAHREDWRESARLAGEALDRVGESDTFFRILALQALAEAQRQSGNAEAATRLFREGFELGENLGHPFAALIALTGLVPNLNRQGRRREALAYCRRVLERNVDGRGKPLPIAGLLHVPLGMLYYAANELEAARDHVLQGLALYKELRLDRIAVGDGEWTLVQILCARGEFEAALALARETERLAASANYTRMALLMAATVADVQLKMGDLASAARWAEGAQLSLPIPPNASYEMAYLILVRVLLAQQRIEEALLLLGNLNQSAKQDGRCGRLITTFIQQALAHHALGNRDVALDRLDSAVQLAAPEEYRRAFLDEGPVVAELLPYVRERAPAFVDGVLQAFAREGREAFPEESAETDNETPGDAVRSPHPAVQALSDREREVLRLLAEGKSNAEIAQALVVTVGTAKWHVHNVLDKLGAGNRTQAVAQARMLHLL